MLADGRDGCGGCVSGWMDAWMDEWMGGQTANPRGSAMHKPTHPHTHSAPWPCAHASRCKVVAASWRYRSIISRIILALKQRSATRWVILLRSCAEVEDAWRIEGTTLGGEPLPPIYCDVLSVSRVRKVFAALVGCSGQSLQLLYPEDSILQDGGDGDSELQSLIMPP